MTTSPDAGAGTGPAPLLDADDAQAITDEYGPTCYLLDRDRLLANAERLRQAFTARYPDTVIAYSYKTNAHPAVCAALAGAGFGAEVACDPEYRLARELGIPPERIVLNGPARSDAVLVDALLAGARVNLDGERDLALAVRLAGSREPGSPDLRVGLRLARHSDGTSASRFGFPEDRLAAAAATIAATPGLRLVGLHCHVADRDPASVAARTRLLLATAADLLPAGPEYLDVGGSLYGGVPARYQAGPYAGAGPTAADYAAAVAAELGPGTLGMVPRLTLVLEPGAAIVATAMSLLTEVSDVRRVGERVVATVTASQFDVSPNTRRDDFPVTVLRRHDAAPADGPFDVAGRTLLEGDLIARDVPGPVAEGDLLLVRNVGAYSVTMSRAWMSEPLPILVRDAVTGRWSDAGQVDAG